MNPDIKFYGLNIDKPMSKQLLVGSSRDTELSKLKDMSDGAIDIKPIPHAYRNASYIWRVVNINISQEDAVMTRFRAFDIEGRLRTEAAFGIWFGPYQSLALNASLSRRLESHFEDVSPSELLEVEFTTWSGGTIWQFEGHVARAIPIHGEFDLFDGYKWFHLVRSYKGQVAEECAICQAER